MSNLSIWTNRFDHNKRKIIALKWSNCMQPSHPLVALIDSTRYESIIARCLGCCSHTSAQQVRLVNRDRPVVIIGLIGTYTVSLSIVTYYVAPCGCVWPSCTRQWSEVHLCMVVLAAMPQLIINSTSLRSPLHHGFGQVQFSFPSAVSSSTEPNLAFPPTVPT